MEKRVACANSNCGTFPMDEEQYNKLQRTGDTFYCPDGHAQHFTESVEKRLKERVDKLERDVDYYRGANQRLQDNLDDEKKKRKDLEQKIIPKIEETGVIELVPDVFIWKCECGSRGAKGYDREPYCQHLYEEHRKREHDEEFAEKESGNSE